jgi:hypothetical protein
VIGPTEAHMEMVVVARLVSNDALPDTSGAWVLEKLPQGGVRDSELPGKPIEFPLRMVVGENVLDLACGDQFLQEIPVVARREAATATAVVLADDTDVDVAAEPMGFVGMDASPPACAQIMHVDGWAIGKALVEVSEHALERLDRPLGAPRPTRAKHMVSIPWLELDETTSGPAPFPPLATQPLRPAAPRDLLRPTAPGDLVGLASGGAMVVAPPVHLLALTAAAFRFAGGVRVLGRTVEL